MTICILASLFSDRGNIRMNYVCFFSGKEIRRSPMCRQRSC